MDRLRLLHIAFCLLLAALVCVPRARATEGIKLYLKDGSYQLVKNYEIHGDRVRYYSLERSQWEEMPASLVDFDATKRAQQEEQATAAKEVERAQEIEKERFDKPAATGLEVAPGVHLPNTEGVYAYDGTRLIPMIQDEGEIVTDKERMVLNLALPAPLLKKRAIVVLAGPQAAVRISATRPVFFVQAADGWGARALLLPVKPGKASRVLEKVQSGRGVGKPGEQREAIAIERQEIAPGVFKLHPVEPLKPGEYAVGELVGDRLNLDVWDFGIEGASRKVQKVSQPAPSAAPAAMSEHRPGQPEQTDHSLPLPRTSPPDPTAQPMPQQPNPPLPPRALR
ncbi:MAG TPA: hypothetical protein VGW33_02060 [Terriglobia bacterium]|nr:hypothetical protein [Terriglobia bacterium]